jgi:anthranilate phosphoribosyltransferase
MEYNNETLAEFGVNIQRLINKDDLSRQESYEMFRQTLQNLQPDLQQGAFLSALAAKGETTNEIAGAWEAIYEFDTKKADLQYDVPVVENSGTGMDQLKTFNVSSAAAIIASAGGVRIARHGARALTSKCGTVDLLETLGVDVECEVETVASSIQKAGIGLFNGMSPKTHPVSLARILSQIRFGSTLNIAASLASPCKPTHGLRGVFSKDIMKKAALVMKEIGYKRAMIVHGLDSESGKGMDELSNLGDTFVLEFFPDGAEKTYVIKPEDAGLKKAAYNSIAALGDIEEESKRFLKVICGEGPNECIDIACLNAAAIFYVSGHTDDITSGVDMSREIIESQRAVNQLVKWIRCQNDDPKEGLRKLGNVAEKSGVSIDI